MTNKHPIETEELMAYLDGELPADRATVAVAHLERCPDCQAFAAEVRDVSRRLMAWEVEAPAPHVPAKIIAELEERERKRQKPTTSSPIPRTRLMTRRWAWAGAFAILCVVVGLMVETPLYKVQRMERATGLSVPQTAARTKRVTESANAATGAAADSNGLFHGLGDHAKNSFSRNGQPLSDQQSKEFEKTVLSAELQSPASMNLKNSAGPMIIRTAGVTLTTNDFDRARAGLDEILKRHRGYIGELNVSTPTGSGRSFTATLRVPGDQLDATISDLRKLGRVESESQSGQEVTAQYVDLEARLANARHTEERLTDLLRQRTGKLSDVLAFEKEIDRVRGEIEQMEAERKNLRNQVEFAAISATVSEEFREQLQLPVSTSGRMRNAAVDGYRTMVEGVVGLVLFLFSYGPSLLLWGGILFFPARFAWKKVQRRFAR